MVELHPQIIRKADRDEFVVLPYEEWVALQDVLADAQDLLDLRQAKHDEGAALGVSLEEVRRRFDPANDESA